MDIIVSHLPYLGCYINALHELPKEYGIEVFIEYGNDYFWKYTLKEMMEGRTGRLSIHAPFCQMNLASDKCNFEEVKETYKWTFDLCQKHNAIHCVCHPCAGVPDDPDFVLEDGQKLALERVLELNSIANSMGVEMLVENMPYQKLVFQQEDFTRVFGGAPELNFLIDIGHAMLHKWDIPKLLKDLNSRIRAYHVHENYSDIDAHLKVGEGPLDWQKFFNDFKQYTPDARLVLEYLHGPVSEIVDTIGVIKGYLGE